MTDGAGLILNPQDYIHAYATRTPAMSGQGALYGRPGSRGPSSREHDPNGFAKELRDQGLTMSQRAANRFQAPLPGQVSTTPPASLSLIYHYRSPGGKGSESVDELTRRMQRNMATGEGAAGEYRWSGLDALVDASETPFCAWLSSAFAAPSRLYLSVVPESLRPRAAMASRASARLSGRGKVCSALIALLPWPLYFSSQLTALDRRRFRQPPAG
uniref:Uncharacterized protein n=1 Tax=Plectus sambesii TaxID=2011161 RepID=A0A914WY33_9BILA